ncbi:hypothetical protein BDF14DRAFT_1381389 [Spinellus fusiger]|nr:hypothetical protein BDF14DRAFT_1381389 [Spinellus fusiger]
MLVLLLFFFFQQANIILNLLFAPSKVTLSIDQTVVRRLLFISNRHRHSIYATQTPLPRRKKKRKKKKKAVRAPSPPFFFSFFLFFFLLTDLYCSLVG